MKSYEADPLAMMLVLTHPVGAPQATSQSHASSAPRRRHAACRELTMAAWCGPHRQCGHSGQHQRAARAENGHPGAATRRGDPPHRSAGGAQRPGRCPLAIGDGRRPAARRRLPGVAVGGSRGGAPPPGPLFYPRGRPAIQLPGGGRGPRAGGGTAPRRRPGGGRGGRGRPGGGRGGGRAAASGGGGACRGRSGAPAAAAGDGGAGGGRGGGRAAAAGGGGACRGRGGAPAAQRDAGGGAGGGRGGGRASGRALWGAPAAAAAASRRRPRGAGAPAAAAAAAGRAAAEKVRGQWRGPTLWQVAAPAPATSLHGCLGLAGHGHSTLRAACCSISPAASSKPPPRGWPRRRGPAWRAGRPPPEPGGVVGRQPKRRAAASGAGHRRLVRGDVYRRLSLPWPYHLSTGGVFFFTVSWRPAETLRHCCSLAERVSCPASTSGATGSHAGPPRVPCAGHRVLLQPHAQCLGIYPGHPTGEDSLNRTPLSSRGDFQEQDPLPRCRLSFLRESSCS